VRINAPDFGLIDVNDPDFDPTDRLQHFVWKTVASTPVAKRASFASDCQRLAAGI
jgi:hypothetical protein